MLSQMAGLPSFSHLNNIPVCVCVCMCVRHLLYSFIYWQTLRLSLYFGDYKYCCSDHGVQISLWCPVLVAFGHTPRSGIVGSCGMFIFNFLRNHQTVLHSDSINSHRHQQCTRMCFSLQPCQQLSSLAFLITAILIGVKGRCGLDLHFPGDPPCRALFLCLLAICMSSLQSGRAHFLIILFFLPYQFSI